MSSYSLITLPAPILRQKCAPLSTVTQEDLLLLDEMVSVMQQAQGVGLAASQVGVLKRLVVMDAHEGEEDIGTIEYLINPEIVWASEEKNRHEEGCLSIPDARGFVERPAVVRVRFLDRMGQPREEVFEKLRATCIQHEIDHLNGVLFIDHLPRFIRNRIIKKFAKKQNREEEV